MLVGERHAHAAPLASIIDPPQNHAPQRDAQRLQPGEHRRIIRRAGNDLRPLGVEGNVLAQVGTQLLGWELRPVALVDGEVHVRIVRFSLHGWALLYEIVPDEASRWYQ